MTVTLQLGNQLTADRTEIRFGAVAGSDANGTIYAWNSAQTVTLTSLGDLLTENRISSLVTHTLTSSMTSDGTYSDVEAGYKEEILVDVIDANTATIEIIETDGSTVVSQTQLTDTYQIKLTKAPVAEVRVGINVDGKAEILTDARVIQAVYADGDVIPSGSSVGDPIVGRYYAVFSRRRLEPGHHHPAIQRGPPGQ